MKLSEMICLRLIRQQLTGKESGTPQNVISRMGALQAQDYAMAKWGLGVRLPGSTDQLITQAIDKGEIIRTHVLRPTWHFVSAEDIYWMLELSAPQIKSVMRFMDKQLELDEAIFSKSNKLIQEALEGNRRLSRDTLMRHLEQNGIVMGNNRLSHLLIRAELEQLICSGTLEGNKPCYTLLEERVHRDKPLHRDEALAKLAGKYFYGHGPATLQDFAWWSGLSLKDARHALEMVKTDFISEVIGDQIYWMESASSASYVFKKPAVHLLPAFDEFLISYKDRTAALCRENQKLAFTNNGIFKPIITVNGKVTGIWKRTIRKSRVFVEVSFFNEPEKAVITQLLQKVSDYGKFLGMETELSFN